MDFIRSQVFCVFVSVFVILFCVDLAYRVEGNIILKIANIGDNITLSCYRPEFFWNRWFRNETLIANPYGVKITDPRFTQRANSYGHLSNKIYISSVRINDSATFKCRNFNGNELHSYDLRVIRCSNCIITNHENSNKRKVICNLDNYSTRQALFQNIILNGNIYRTAAILGSALSFSINVTELNRLNSEFYLQIETESRITCMLPTQPTPPSSPTTTLPTTYLKQTAQNRPSTLSYTASNKLPVGRSTSVSTTKHHTPKNKNTNSNQNTRDGNITLIIVILGSVFILILIVIIIVLRCKKTKDRRENKHTGNASIKKEQPEVCYESVEDGSGKGPEYATSIKELRETSLDQRSADHADKRETPEVCYESVEDGSRKGPEYATSMKEMRETSLYPRSATHSENGGMIDNILYASRDKIADSSISRLEGPLDDALYAIPDKRATINRESKSTSKVTDGSSNSDHLYGKSAIITQHEQIRGTLHQGDQYENVKMPGSGGDAEEIALYEMPDEEPTRNTLKATPEAGQTPTLPKDEVVSVDALYAEVDKTKKKYTNN